MLQSPEIAAASLDARRFLDRLDSLKNPAERKFNFAKAQSFGEASVDAPNFVTPGPGPEARFISNTQELESGEEELEKSGKKRLFLEKELTHADNQERRGDDVSEMKKKKI